MKKLPANLGRGAVGMAALVMMFAGACVLWGIGGGMLTLGAFISIDCSLDEVVERFTNTERSC